MGVSRCSGDPKTAQPFSNYVFPFRAQDTHDWHGDLACPKSIAVHVVTVTQLFTLVQPRWMVRSLFFLPAVTSHHVNRYFRSLLAYENFLFYTQISELSHDYMFFPHSNCGSFTDASPQRTCQKVWGLLMVRLHADGYPRIGGEEFDDFLHSQMPMSRCPGT